MSTKTPHTILSHDTTITILPPADVFDTLAGISTEVHATILDPWYNRGVGGAIGNYDGWLERLVRETARFSNHIFLWGFPDIVHNVLNRLPVGFKLVAWLTWYYKNCPSVIRGWRSAQFACLHLCRENAPLYPENFLNDIQLEKFNQGKLRYIPGPPTVLEVPLNIGFVGKSEQTGHPAQKPMKVIEPLILMSTKAGDLVLDPMCGSGTTGEVCLNFGRRAILCDESPDWIAVAEARVKDAEVRIGGIGRSHSQRPLFTEIGSGEN